MKRFKNIDFLKDVDNAKPCDLGGFSATDKFIVEKKGQKYFVKFTKEVIHKDLKTFMEEAQIPHAKIISHGKLGDEYYIVEELSEYKTLRNYFDQLTNQEIYNLAFNLGEKYRYLRKLYPDKPVDEENYQKIVKLVLERILDFSNVHQNAQSLNNTTKKQLFDLQNLLLNKLGIMKSSSLVFGHADVHPDNFLFKDKNTIIAIDFEDTGYSELSFAIRYSLACNKAEQLEKFSYFAKGYLEGLFEFNLPQNLINCLDYMYCYMIFRNAVSLLRNKKFEELEIYLKSANLENTKTFTNKK